MQSRYSSWKKLDRNLTAYIVPDEDDKKIKMEDDRKPVNVVIPVSYAVLETLLTYFVGVYFAPPIFRYEGTGPEDVVGAALLELVIAQQVHRQKMLLDLYTMWRDSLIYGIGAVSPVWTTKTALRTVRSDEGILSALDGLFRKIGISRSREEVVIYEGNKLESIDPYKLLPDPNVSVHKIQDAEYIGWVTRSNRVTVLSEEYDRPGVVFNARYLEHIDGRSIYWDSDHARTERFGVPGTSVTSNVALSTKPVDLLPMYMKLVPSEWGLGNRDRPEKWFFVLAGDQLIVQARPLGLDHDMYPVAIAAPDYDGHSACPIGRLEVEYGMQETIDFMIRGFVAEQRKSINNTFVVNPEVINIHDFAAAKHGGIVRVRKLFWGEGKVSDAIHQVAVNNVTQANIPNIQYFRDIMNDTSGAVDSLRGLFRKSSERISATESRDTRSSALSRLEKAARLAGIQAHYDIALQMAWNTRQLLEEEYFVKLVGRHEQDLKKEFGLSGFAKVSPSSLDVSVDILAHDGTLSDEGDAQSLLTLMQIASKDQELRQTLDYTRIVKAIARRSGETNVEDFVRKTPVVNPQVQPDQAVEQQVQEGNLVPLVL
jgi:hypothetical protein